MKSFDYFLENFFKKSVAFFQNNTYTLNIKSFDYQTNLLISFLFYLDTLIIKLFIVAFIFF